MLNIYLDRKKGDTVCIETGYYPIILHFSREHIFRKTLQLNANYTIMSFPPPNMSGKIHSFMHFDIYRR